MSFGEPWEAFSRIKESCDGMRRRRSAARFDTDNLFSREASMAEPTKSGAPYNVEFLISSCTKSVSGATDTEAVLVMLSHLLVLRCTSNDMPLSLSEVTSVATMFIGPSRVMSSI